MQIPLTDEVPSEADVDRDGIKFEGIETGETAGDTDDIENQRMLPFPSIITSLELEEENVNKIFKLKLITT